MTDDCVIAARDPNGFRPLVLGEVERILLFRLGELRVRPAGGEGGQGAGNGRSGRSAGVGRVESYRVPHAETPSRCVFEQVYFARPDSQVFGDPVSRRPAGDGKAHLAREAPAPADIVVPVPDSGLFAALGYARESGLPMEFGLIRNHYVGRTFIEPQQSIRHFGVKVKLNPCP